MGIQTWSERVLKFHGRGTCLGFVVGSAWSFAFWDILE